MAAVVAPVRGIAIRMPLLPPHRFNDAIEGSKTYSMEEAARELADRLQSHFGSVTRSFRSTLGPKVVPRLAS